ncbi:uncharacterized protein ACRADG_003211 [Cochliomyia hominivorax]
MVFKPRCDIWQHFENNAEEGIAVCKLCKQRLKNYSSYVLRRHIQKLHNANSEVWKYFDNLVGEGLAVCKQCNHRVRNNRSFNLTQHLQVSHNIIVSDIEDGFTLKKPESSQEMGNLDVNKTNSISNEDMPVSTRVLQQKVVEICNYRPPLKTYTNNRIKLNTSPSDTDNILLDIDMKEKDLTSAVWGLMLDEGVAPPIFASKNMQSLINPICNAISLQENKEFKLSETESEKMLNLALNHLKLDFASNLNWRLLSLKLDMDLNGSSKIFCLSTAFIQDDKLETRSLGIIHLKDDSQLTGDHIKEVLNKYNIDSNQIISVYCDFSKSKYYTQVENSEYLKEIAKFEQFPDISFGNKKIERYVGVTAQLCLLDIFKNPDILQTFLGCRNFVQFIGDSNNGFDEIFEQNNLNIPELDSPWKWGSTYEMIYDLQQARSLLSDIDYPKDENPEKQFEVNDDLWHFVDAFCESLKFIQKTINKFYNEEIHFGDFYAQWLKCKLLTAKLASNSNTQNNHYIAKISKELLNAIEIRSKDILNKDYYKACLFLDPRFHHTLKIETKNNAIDYLKKLWSLSKMYNPDVVNTVTHREEISSTQSFLNEEDAFLNEFLLQTVSETDTRTYEVHNNIARLKLPFKAVDTNILKFWHNLKSNEPEIYPLSAICFAIPTTQVYNKNTYSHIYKAENHLKVSSTRANLVCIRLNSSLVANCLENIGIFYETTTAAN